MVSSRSGFGKSRAEPEQNTLNVTQSTLEDDVDEDNPCQGGSEWCDGPEMLEDGRLCCFPCFNASSDEQRRAFQRMRAAAEALENVLATGAGRTYSGP